MPNLNPTSYTTFITSHAKMDPDFVSVLALFKFYVIFNYGSLNCVAVDKVYFIDSFLSNTIMN